jgi:hypothetical protein
MREDQAKRREKASANTHSTNRSDGEVVYRITPKKN